MDFTTAFHELLGHEGGYSNHENDPGGETMWGVTKVVAREHGYEGLMKDLPLPLVTVADENTFTVTVADAGNASGDLSIYNDVLLQVTVSTVSSSTVVIPGEGILAEDGIRVILSNSVTDTIFYG